MSKYADGLKFMLTGAGLSALGLANFAVLHLVFSAFLHYMAIYLIAYIVNLMASYLVYSKTVFGELRPSIGGLVRYSTTTVGNFLVSAFVLFLVVESTGLDPVITRVGVALVTAPIMFLVHRNFTFRRD